METRNREEGWKYAKISGHENEYLIKKLIEDNLEYSKKFLKRINRENESIEKVVIGGLNETNVPSVNGNKTKSKTDLKIFLKNGETINISIKKSLGGQVYLVSSETFIKTFETQFNQIIPENVKKAIKLFWSGNGEEALHIIKKYADQSEEKNYDSQIRHKSLNATTLKNYSQNMYNELLNWFYDNIYKITKLSFSMGAVANENEWSDYIWYKNLVDDEIETDSIFLIEELSDIIRTLPSNSIYYGEKNGGTTIQLPFGFVQWHQSKLQFHHDYKKIAHMIVGK
jgi:hypothetical protein